MLHAFQTGTKLIENYLDKKKPGMKQKEKQMRRKTRMAAKRMDRKETYKME